MSIVMLAIAGAVAHAGDVYFPVSAGWFWTSPDENIDSTWLVQPRLGYTLGEHLAVEAGLGIVQGDTRTLGRTYDGLTPRGELVYTPVTSWRIAPFVAAGPGLIRKAVRRDDSVVSDQPNEAGWGNYKNPDVDFLLTAGPGVRVPVTDTVALRSDVRYALNLGSDPHGDRQDVFSDWEWTIGVELRAGSRDRDLDGFANRDDACPDAAEDVDGFRDADGCPDLDNDDDGIADTADACPTDPEDADGFEDTDGCPDLDNDSDGLADLDDVCPDAAEDVDGFEDADGCPDLDNDNDEIADRQDECPDIAGTAERDGCPQVVVEATRIEIHDRVFFAHNRAEIRPESHDLLRAVAGVLREHTELTLVEIAGHTDDIGADAYNLRLSQARAEAVRAFLVAEGVDAPRLAAVGYGEGEPLGPNDTDEGRAANRRVELRILERSDEVSLLQD